MRRTVSLVLASLALAAGPALAQVQTLHWRGLVSDVINDPANWLEGAFPAEPPDVVFGLGPAGPLQLLAFGDDISLRNLRFEDAARPAYTFFSTTADRPTVSLGGDVTLQSGAPVIIEDSISVLLVPGLHTFTVDADTSLTVLAPLQHGSASARLEKQGAGRLELGGPSTFTGGVMVRAGELRLRSSSSGSPVTTGPVGTGSLQLAAGTRLTSETPAGSSLLLHNALELLGNVEVGREGHPLTLAGLIAGAGDLDILGPVTLAYSGNTYSGNTHVHQGELVLSAPHTLPALTKVRLGADTRMVVWFDQVIDRLLGDLASEVELAAGTLQVQFTSNSIQQNYAGKIFGPGALAVANSSTDARAFILDGVAEHTGGTSIASGARLQIGQGGATGSIAGPIANAGSISFARHASAPALTVDGVISGSGRVINTSGVTVLAAENSYTGGTTIAGGTMAASAPGAFGAQPVAVHAGATLSLLNGTSINNALQLAPGSTLAGEGGYGHAIIGAGVTLSPGAGTHSVGTLRFEDLTLSGGGLYEWNLLAPGVHDQVLLPAATAGFHVTASAANPFILQLVTLSANGTPGVATGFGEGAHTWTLFEAAAGLGGFDTNSFRIDGSAFLTNLGPGDFLLAQQDGLLQLTFTPIPEPSTYLLMITGLGVIGWRQWRRRRGA